MEPENQNTGLIVEPLHPLRVLEDALKVGSSKDDAISAALASGGNLKEIDEFIASQPENYVTILQTQQGSIRANALITIAAKAAMRDDPRYAMDIAERQIPGWAKNAKLDLSSGGEPITGFTMTKPESTQEETPPVK